MNWRSCYVVGWMLVTSLSFQVQADDLFEKPVRLMTDGKIIDTGSVWGHSSPCLEDVDGDKLPDLILGDFSGNFRYYKNVGEPGKPSFKSNGFLQANGQNAHVRIYCCVGSQARFVDLDADGIRDFVSSSYDPGYCYFFRGLGNNRYAASKELVDKSGTPVRSQPRQKQEYQSFGSFFTPVDWDADGDFDMLIGCFDGTLKLRLNEGTPTNMVWASENLDVTAGDAPLKVGAHCCPVVVDWDSDGQWDILASADDGSVSFFRNVGEKSKPRFAAPVTLVGKHEGSGYDKVLWSENEIVPGIRAQIDVADLNADGKLDLLLGDFTSVYNFRPDLTEADKAQVKELVAKTRSMSGKFGEKIEAMRADFMKRYPGDAINSDEANKEWQKAYQAIRSGPEYEEMQKNEKEFTSSIRPFLASVEGSGTQSHEMAKPHGYVWVFIRK